MDINKLAPWNWFKKEQEQEGNSLPVLKRDTSSVHPGALFHMQREMDRLFDDFYSSFGLPGLSGRRPESTLARTDWLKPTLDVGASEKEYTITVELPGVTEKDVQLELTGDTLKIKGEKKQEKEERDKNYYRVERSYGSFQRVLSLPEDADRENIRASYKNGIMTVKVPRQSVPHAAARQIEIKAA